MENKYWFLDHTADVLFRAKASTVEQLFRQAGLATFATMTDLESIGTEEIRKFSIKANSLEYLLFDFLDELLMYKDSEILFFSDFKVVIFQDPGSKKWVCEAECFGEVSDDSKHDRKLDVKAITLHLFEVKQEKEAWTCQVLLDI